MVARMESERVSEGYIGLQCPRDGEVSVFASLGPTQHHSTALSMLATAIFDAVDRNHDGAGEL